MVIKSKVKCGPLKKLFMAFADEIFERKNPIPDYSRLESMIAEEINKFAQPAVFAWLNCLEKQIAPAELRNSPFDITKTIDPPIDFEIELHLFC